MVESPVRDWETSSWKAERRWADGARMTRLLKPEHLTIEDAIAVAEGGDIRTLEGLNYSILKELSEKVLARWANGT